MLEKEKANWRPSGKSKLSKPNTTFYSIAGIWPKYCSNKLKPKINQSINQSILRYSPVDEEFELGNGLFEVPFTHVYS
jgi:hypothetical protein